jgi:hypothetical protein
MTAHAVPGRQYQLLCQHLRGAAQEHRLSGRWMSLFAVEIHCWRLLPPFHGALNAPTQMTWAAACCCSRRHRRCHRPCHLLGCVSRPWLCCFYCYPH